MDATPDPALEPVEIPRAHPETTEETYARIEANLRWEEARRMEDAARQGKELLDAEEAEISGLHVSGDIDTFFHGLRERRFVWARARVLYRELVDLGCVLYVEYGALRIEPRHVVPTEMLAYAYGEPMRSLLEGFADERHGRFPPEDLCPLQEVES